MKKIQKNITKHRITTPVKILFKETSNVINPLHYEAALALLYQRENIHKDEMKKSQENLSKSQEEILQIKAELEKSLKNAMEWKKKALHYLSIIADIKAVEK